MITEHELKVHHLQALCDSLNAIDKAPGGNVNVTDLDCGFGRVVWIHSDDTWRVEEVY